MLNKIFLTLNLTTLILTLTIAEVLISITNKILWKKTKLYLCVSYVFIFIILPFTWFNETNIKTDTAIMYVEYDLTKIFIITNIVTLLMFRQTCLNTIFIDDYYNKFPAQYKSAIKDIIKCTEHAIELVTPITIIFLILYWHLYGLKKTDSSIYIEYLFLLYTYIFIVSISCFNFFLMFLNFYKYNFFQKNDFEWKFKLTRNKFHFIWLLVILTLSIFILTHIYIIIICNM